MASFLRPINRRKAEALVAELLQRVRLYNGDLGKPMFIIEVGVFGSYLDLTVQQLGDVDLTVTLTARPGTNDPDTRQAYAHQSGRRFTSFIDELIWPEKEALQQPRHRSPYLNLHQ